MERVNNCTYWRRWTHGMSWLLIGTLVILMVGCTTPPSVPNHITATPIVFSWEALQQRPLHLPSLRPGTLCPTTHGKPVIPGFDLLLGNERVYADFFGGNSNDNEQGVLRYADAQSFGGGIGNSGWGGQKVLWFIDPAYHGPALIRGEQLDGTGQMRFDSSSVETGIPAAQTLVTALRVDAEGGGPWPNWSSYTRLQKPGCYAYQVDGPGFSEVIVFEAIAIHFSLKG